MELFSQERERHSSKRYKVLFTLTWIITIAATLIVDIHLLMNQLPATVENDAMDYTSQDTNQTLCSYLKQFRLSENKKVSVCAIEDAVCVDIRIFYNNQASIRGIWLDVTEWRTLLKLWGSIQTAMAIAENELD